MGRTDEIQEGDLTQQPQQVAPGQLKQPEAEGPPSKQAKVEKGEEGGAARLEEQTERRDVGGEGGGDAQRGGQQAFVEANRPVTRLDDGTMNEQESLESMRESNAPHTGEELYKDAVHPEAPQHEHHEQHHKPVGAVATSGATAQATASTTQGAAAEPDKPVTRLDDGTMNVQESLESMRESNAPHTGEELYKDAVHPEAPQHEHQEKHAEAKQSAPPSKRAKGTSPRASSEGVTKPVTRLDDGTLDKQESLESMRESNTPHTGEQLYEDAVPAAEGTATKAKGKGSKRSRRSA